jgi:hypothetical protein
VLFRSPARKFPAVFDASDAPPLPLSRDDLHKAFVKMPRRSSTHRDGWRWEHLQALTEHNVAVANDLLAWIQLLLAGSLPPEIRDFLRSSTLIAFHKLSPEERRRLAMFDRRIRPIAIGSVLIRAALTLVLILVREPLARYLLQNHQFVFGFSSACDALTHALRVSLELQRERESISITTQLRLVITGEVAMHLC